MAKPTAALARLAELSVEVDITEGVRRAVSYAQDVISERTRKGYANEFARFAAWADEQKLPSLPTSPEIVAVYLAALADGKVRMRWVGRGSIERETQTKKTPATIERAFIGIIHAQREAGHEWPRAHPLLARVMRGIRRKLGTKQKRVAAIGLADLRALIEQCPKTLAGARDRAMLSIGFFAALRRSELVALDAADIKATPKGLLVTIRKAKEDQTANGRTVALPRTEDESICPVRLLRAWLKASKIELGPLFRRIDRGGNLGSSALSSQVVGMIIKQLADAAGLDASKFSGHSLRAGFVTSAAQAGKSFMSIMNQTGHRDIRTAMTYIRPATVWDDNAADGLA
ncbi:MAG TPA: site-specific integrase [Gemmatimonadaceae bacterium]|nr:site-specific integrase [Gemmatimonadaceae bacterium]